MIQLSKLLALPTALLTLAIASEAGAQNIEPATTPLRYVEYGFEREQHRRRDTDETAAWDSPMELRKMSNDEGEKFFPHYWNFGQSLQNSSHAHELQSPIAPHVNHGHRLRRSAGQSLFARDYKCPTGTNACSSLGSDLCCPDKTICVATKNSGVGCCPGNDCGDTVGKCDESAGYTSCPNQLNGGCCIPGAICQEAGCVLYGTQTVTVSGVVRTVTAGASSSTAPTSSNSGYTTTVTVTQSLSGQITTIVSTLVSATTIIVGASCSESSCSTSSGSATASAPVQPTSVSSSETSVSAATVTSQSTQTSDEMCPTGFYMCSAYYMGGCCRVGRNCDTTSCPHTDSTAVEVSGATVFVPVSASATAASTAGSCANGWAFCPASVGGGCCPSKYICGTASCTAQASGEQNTAKEAPSSASVVRWAWSFFALSLATGLGMVVL